MTYRKPAVDVAADLREAAERLAVEYAELMEAVERLPDDKHMYKEQTREFYSAVRAAVIKDIRLKTDLLLRQKNYTYFMMERIQEEAADNAP